MKVRPTTSEKDICVSEGWGVVVSNNKRTNLYYKFAYVKKMLTYNCIVLYCMTTQRRDRRQQEAPLRQASKRQGRLEDRR